MSKYNLKEFNKAVKYYEMQLKRYKEKTIFIVFEATNEQAYFSLAPLSRAAHNLKCDLNVSLIQKPSKPIQAMLEVWDAYEQLQAGVKSHVTKALREFIGLVEKKAKGEFTNIFKRPALMIDANDDCFVTNGGFDMLFQTQWFRKYKWNELMQTSRVVWKQVLDLKLSERVGIGFDLIARAEDIKDPLEDYLDSYAIARTMYLGCPAKKKTMKSATHRKSMLAKGERIGELSATLLGCELSKDINEPIFRKFKILSRLLKLDRIGTNDASFFVSGEGYGGKHLFGEKIGYPTPNRKSRWDSPGGIVYQLPWYPQTKLDSRPPFARVAFTSTVPIDKYVESCNIDWMKMKRIDDKLIALVNKSEKIFVESKKTNLEVGLVGKNGQRRMPLNSDVDTRTKLDPLYLKKGIKAGTMANVPGGEMFFTPEYIKGTFYGDVVISIDKSHVLNSKDPLVIKCMGNKYDIVRGPKKVIAQLKKKRNESMKMLKLQEKSKSLPKEIIALKKSNFLNIGEFAINTNPRASLCNYLIVNEKIAGMMHIALGSGFEPDRAGLYHYDVVINAKEQKLDIYGVGKKGEKHWLMKKGKLAVK
ncbi:hypothetical protein JW711_01010 [Candidatus Woesearchaeota archaeon]|nr:hypothetical protein [Candidatus Woesearchaeota archaeon]